MRKILFLLLIALITMSSVAFSQVSVVTGTVTGDDGAPLPGAAVQIKGTATGVTTDLDGNYSIDVSAYETPSLTYTYVGYITQEVQVGSQSKIDIVLVTDALSVDELVIIGYGVQKKSLVSGAISKVKAEDLVDRPSARVEQALQGKVTGVSILAQSGSPGAGMTVKIRGAGSNTNNNPLFIVDGMRTKGIDYLSPADIESVEILKDAASAAIYGSEGGNGVILITTKKGKKGTVKVDYNMYTGRQYFQSNFEAMSAEQYLSYLTDATQLEAQGQVFTGSGEVRPFDDPTVQNYFDIFMTQRNIPRNIIDDIPIENSTTWIDEVTEIAPMMSHDLSISGGSEKTTYSGSLGYYNQDGVVGGDQANFKRYTFRLNAEHMQNDWLTIGVKMNYALKQRKNVSENDEFGSVILNTMFFDPTVPLIYEYDSLAPTTYQASSDYFVRDEQDHAYGMSELVRNEILNPVAQLQNSHRKFTEDKILAGSYITLSPIENLIVRTSIDVDIANNQTKEWFPQAFYNSVTFTDYTDVTEERHRFLNWQSETYASYNFQLQEKNNFTAMVGYSLIEQNHEWVGMRARGLVRDNDDFAHIGFALGDTLIGVHTYPRSGIIPQERMESMFGRLTYNYDEQFTLNLTLRRDGSSLLAPGYDYKFYPSYSASWVISNMSSWSVPAISLLKLRASYGTNGNKRAISRSFFYAPLVRQTGYTYTDLNGTILQGAVPISLTNPTLTWETVKMLNLGVDMTLLQNKVGVTLEYYKKTTEDWLDLAQLPDYIGNEPPFTNEGTIDNSGIEFELSYRHMEGELNFEVGANITYMTNEVVSLQTEDSYLTGTNLGVSGPVTRSEAGYPLYYYYGYQADGVWESWDQILAENYIDGDPIQESVMPGDIRIVDVNNDSIIDGGDLTMIGNPHEKVIGGLNFNLYYKFIDFGMSFVGTFGRDLYNGTYRNDIATSNKPAYYYTDGFFPGEGGDFFRPTYTSNWNFNHNSMFVEDGSFIRLKNMQIGFTLPKSISERLTVSKLRAYVSVNNIWTWTKYRGTDPEFGTTSGFVTESGEWIEDVASYGVDRGFYPAPKSFLIGLNVTF